MIGIGSEKIRKCVCIPAYILVALCALLYTIETFGVSGAHDWMYFGIQNKTGRTIINSVYFIAAVITLICAIGWMIRSPKERN